ncbi:MAG: hypothetical protein K6E53_13815 [Lachnospiraceae bacterium]|nr:hypothetical protein [Lachnospiraceae bacterium]
MNIEKMNEQISRLKEEKKAYDEKMGRKIAELEKNRDLALAAQTQKVFARHHLSPDELVKLKYASKEQLARVLEFIEDEITQPAKPAAKPELKKEDN